MRIKRIIALVALGAILGGLTTDKAQCAYHAVEVISYTAGSGTNAALQSPSAALGAPNPVVPGAFGYPDQPFNPYTPHYTGTNIVQIGLGGEITLRLERFVIVSPTAPELGVWENVFLVHGSNPAAVAGSDSAEVLVSANGNDFISVGVKTFSWFGNYWNDVSSTNDLDNSDPADFGKPFTKALSDFNGLSFGQVIAALDGTAGGTWIDFDSSGLSQVGWIRFANVSSGTLELDAVAINSSLAGGLTIPEPSSALLFLLGLMPLHHAKITKKRL